MAEETLKEQNERLEKELEAAKEQIKTLQHELMVAQSDCRRLTYANEQLQEAKEVLEQRVNDLWDNVHGREDDIKELGKTMEKSSAYYAQTIKELQAENRKLWKKSGQEPPVHNARGAGRKKNNAEYMQKYLAFCDLVRSGKTMDDIMGIMQISRSTYFRFLKAHREDSKIDEHEKKSLKK